MFYVALTVHFCSLKPKINGVEAAELVAGRTQAVTTNQYLQAVQNLGRIQENQKYAAVPVAARGQPYAIDWTTPEIIKSINNFRVKKGDGI